VAPGILPGQLIVRGQEFDGALLPTALPADPDAIIVTGASDTVEQVYSDTLLDGVISGDRMPLAVNLDLVLSSNADWDLTNATLVGIDENGAQVSETLAIPDAGNVTVPTANKYHKVISLTIPVQSGTNGTFTLGVAAPAQAALNASAVKGIAYNDRFREAARGDLHGTPAPGAIEGTPYNQYEDFSAVSRGRVWVISEDALTPGAAPFVRIVNTAAPGLPSNVGQFRSDADSGNAVLAPSCRVRKVSGTRAEISIQLNP
jgi:hypothetical protein